MASADAVFQWPILSSSVPPESHTHKITGDSIHAQIVLFEVAGVGGMETSQSFPDWHHNELIIAEALSEISLL